MIRLLFVLKSALFGRFSYFSMVLLLMVSSYYIGFAGASKKVIFWLILAEAFRMEKAMEGKDSRGLYENSNICPEKVITMT